jgi:hypothetical protein
MAGFATFFKSPYGPTSVAIAASVFVPKLQEILGLKRPEEETTVQETTVVQNNYNLYITIARPPLRQRYNTPNIYNANAVAGPWIPRPTNNTANTAANYSADRPKTVTLASSQRREICNDLDDVDPTPQQVRDRTHRPDSTESSAFGEIRDDGPNTIYYDTWVTARMSLVYLFNQWAAEQAARRERYGRLTPDDQKLYATMYQHMLDSFYVTQWRLARGYFDNLQDYQNRRYCEASYLNFFNWYGRTVQERLPPGSPRLSDAAIENTADYLFSDLNDFWNLPEDISPDQARGLAFAWSLTDPKPPLVS